MRRLVAEVASGLREHVLPLLGSHAGRAHVQAGAGGDVTFAIDEQAESWLGITWPSGRPGSPSTPRTAGWSSRGAGGPKRCWWSTIDGTRPAMAGLESCCVAVAAAPLATASHPWAT